MPTAQSLRIHRSTKSVKLGKSVLLPDVKLVLKLAVAREAEPGSPQVFSIGQAWVVLVAPVLH